MRREPRPKRSQYSMTEHTAATVSVAGTRRGRKYAGLFLVAIPVFLVAWMVIWPILTAIPRSLMQVGTDGSTSFSFANYQFFFSDRYSLNNLTVTLWTTMVCAALLLVICLPLALYLRFTSNRIAAFVQSLAIFPMFVPSIILSYAFIRVLGPNGTVDLLLNGVGLPRIRSPYLTPWGPVIGLVWDNIPLTVLILVSGLGAVSNATIEAARDVGARRLAILWHIILPRITNSILVAISFGVLGIFSSFTLPYVLGPAAPEMMGPFMQRTFRDLQNPPMAITQAVITFAFCIVFGLFYIRSVAKNRTP
ncbi:ABC-type spermidine/putrescine transport system, permease component I [Devosia crocina]|uniref:ABC-type spermidine/putrescine transport system, permease component I n=2 Tax=Devosia crocina TaxID=429728 RepID=A0A1I7NAX0_9HYPH|nr:ABC-type spermidine/putrescine transport system, permease component I [Devosia crocina]